MSLEFLTVKVAFPSSKGSSQQLDAKADFSGTVVQCCAALSGFQFKYTDGDHDLYEAYVEIEQEDMTISNDNVSVPVSFLLRDKGDIDDAYQGYANVLFIAEIE